MNDRVLLIRILALALLLSGFSFAVRAQQQEDPAKEVVRQYILRYSKNPAGSVAIHDSFDLDDAENLKNATVLDPFRMMRIEREDILAASNGEDLISRSKLLHMVYPIYAEDKVIGYVYTFDDSSSETGWQAGGGSKAQPGHPYFAIYSFNERNPGNEYHALQVVIDNYYLYILEKDAAGGYSLIPFHRRWEADIVGIDLAPDSPRGKISLEKALVIFKERSAEYIKRREDEGSFDDIH